MNIPPLIYHELFGQFKLNELDISINYFCDILEKLGFNISNIVSYGHVIAINIFKLDYVGQLRIDRINKKFELCDNLPMVPVSGDWGVVISYLQSI